jgi:hypothetical protein
MNLRAALILQVMPASSVAYAECPTTETATRGDGYRLNMLNGDYVDVTRIQGRTTYFSNVSKQGQITDSYGLGGMFTSVSQTGKDIRTFEYEIKIADVLPLRLGQRFETKVVIRSFPGQTVTYRMNVNVIGEDFVSIGPRQYRVLVIDRTFDDGKKTNSTRSFLSPDLQFPLKVQSREAGALKTDFEYSSIRPLTSADRKSAQAETPCAAGCNAKRDACLKTPEGTSYPFHCLPAYNVCLKVCDPSRY